jgi:hypothetical protein
MGPELCQRSDEGRVGRNGMGGVDDRGIAGQLLLA